MTKHKYSQTKLYNVYKGMKKRCYLKSNHNYSNYGGRGIYICSEWMENVEAFINWAIVSGYKEGLSIERINNDGNYEPDNCRWATPKEQSNNTRTNHPLTWNGITKNVTQWAEEFGVTDAAIFRRIKSGWAIDKIFTQPFLGQKKLEYKGELLTIKEWAKRLGVHRQIIDIRLRKNWSVEKTLTTPIETKHRRSK